MRKRAEQVDATRRRIVEATVRLHEERGPVGTTVSAIAELADVTRLTVYRHFPDDEALFAACSAHWHAQQRLPDVQAWEQVTDPRQRLETGLSDLYRFFRDGERMLTQIYRDRPTLPETVQAAITADEHAFRDALVGAFGASGARERLLRALAGHAVSFWTWRSLCVEQGLSDRQAVEAAVALVLSAADAERGPGTATSSP